MQRADPPPDRTILAIAGNPWPTGSPFDIAHCSQHPPALTGDLSSNAHTEIGDSWFRSGDRPFAVDGRSGSLLGRSVSDPSLFAIAGLAHHLQIRLAAQRRL